jgi:hypothetical protein
MGSALKQQKPSAFLENDAKVNRRYRCRERQGRPQELWRGMGYVGRRGNLESPGSDGASPHPFADTRYADTFCLSRSRTRP